MHFYINTKNLSKFLEISKILIKKEISPDNCVLYFSVLEQLHGKTLVMSLLGHADHNVRYEALLAVQKLMVHNW